MTRSIGLRNMPTLATTLAGVPRVYKHHGETCELRLVLDKSSELVKRPACHSGALWLAKPRPTADILEVFKGYPSVGAFTSRNERLTDAVVHIPAKARLFSAQTFECHTNPFRPFAVHLCHRCRPLQPLAPFGVARTTGFNASTAVGGAVRCRRKIDHPEVYPHHILRLNLGLSWHVDGTQQVEHAIAQHQIGLSLNTSLPGLLVRSTEKRDFHSATNSPQAGTVQAMEAQHPLVIAHRAVWPEDRACRFIALETLHRLGNGAYRKLGGQPKALSYLVVRQVVQRHLPVYTSGKALRRSIGRRFITQPHGLTQGRMLFGCREQVESQGQFHRESGA